MVQWTSEWNNLCVATICSSSYKVITEMIMFHSKLYSTDVNTMYIYSLLLPVCKKLAMCYKVWSSDGEHCAKYKQKVICA